MLEVLSLGDGGFGRCGENGDDVSGGIRPYQNLIVQPQMATGESIKKDEEGDQRRWPR
jgi:hypothetical protein